MSDTHTYGGIYVYVGDRVAINIDNRYSGSGDSVGAEVPGGSAGAPRGLRGGRKNRGGWTEAGSRDPRSLSLSLSLALSLENGGDPVAVLLRIKKLGADRKDAFSRVGRL